LETPPHTHIGGKREGERRLRRICYKKLWKILIDKDLNKQTLSQVANISASTLTKMSKNESVNTDMLVKICNALNCELHDIVELVADNTGDANCTEA
jgi:DNA-binding Xre family transcriptional regulator